MKNNKFLSLLIGLFAFTACQKDVSKELAPETTETENASVSAILSGLTTVNKESTTEDGNAVIYTRIADAAISTEVLQNGLVLVFAKTSSGMQQIPQTIDGIEWSYEITVGGITISATNIQSRIAANSQSVQYIIISEEQLNELANNGIAKEELLNLSYEKASLLF